MMETKCLLSQHLATTHSVADGEDGRLCEAPTTRFQPVSRGRRRGKLAFLNDPRKILESQRLPRPRIQRQIYSCRMWDELIREIAISSCQARELADVNFACKNGDHGLEVPLVALVADGRKVATDEHLGLAGIPSEKIIFRLQLSADATTNTECKLRVMVRGKGGSDSFGAIRLLAKR